MARPTKRNSANRKSARPGSAKSGKTASRRVPADPTVLRIIGGKYRGRKLLYSGDPQVRPMKDRTREAVFNLLGPAIRGKHAIDLFAGTGALGLEAISRGAKSATLLERHFPTAAVIRKNIATLGVEANCEVHPADTFIWLQRNPTLPAEPWVVFVSPPYDYYVDRREEIVDLVNQMIDRAPSGSLVSVESDKRFDPSLLPQAERWDARYYAPALVAVYQVE